MNQDEYRKVNAAITVLIDGSNTTEKYHTVGAAIEALMAESLRISEASWCMTAISWREVVLYPLFTALSLFFGIMLMVKFFL